MLPFELAIFHTPLFRDLLPWHIYPGKRSSETLGELILENSISQPGPLVCYAICSAIELALSMLILLQSDSGAGPVQGGRDAEWAEEYEYIASLGLASEASRWPE